jgi:phosphatidylserine decarboxylase
MDLHTNIYGVILGLIILVPLAWKWDIDTKIAAISAVCIGFISGFIVQSVDYIWQTGFVVKTILHAFAVTAIAGGLLMWRFYRDPERQPPPIENTIVSPADGKILYIKKTENGQFPFSEKNGKKYALSEFIQSNILPKSGTLIGISMNFLDVHVNRAPIHGKIAISQRIGGLFLSLRKKEAIIENERRLTVIDNGTLKVGVIQIASRMVRNIVSYVNQGEEVKTGQRIGMIRFGSQVDLYLPDAYPVRVNVTVGHKVKAGVSILATYGVIPEIHDNNKTSGRR